MGDKKKSEEFAFGSDSFLDVVANIVGILIILLVIVGLRVKNAPMQLDGIDTVAAQRLAESQRRLAEWEAEKKKIEGENAQALAERRRLERLQREEQERRKKNDQDILKRNEDEKKKLAEREKEIDERTKLQRLYEQEAAALYREIEQLNSEVERSKDKIAEKHLSERELRKERQQMLDQLALIRSMARQSEEETDQLRLSRKELDRQLEELHQQIADMKKTKIPTKKWVHFATPIAQRNVREEAHYRCLKGKVVDTHLSDLIQQLERRIRTGDFSPHNRDGGDRIGPIDGFWLEYSDVVEVDSYGLPHRAHRWDVVHNDDTIGETEKEALAATSKFKRSLTYRPAARYSITLWVYPDSYILAKALRDHLNQNGYLVALRPLPAGIPIGVSPFGTHSRSQ